MKKTINVLYLLTISFTFLACGESKPKKQENSPKKETIEATIDTHKSSSNVQLDNGNLWSANNETTQGIINMQKLLNDFTDTESITAYTSLKTALEKEFGTIITECTMKGESHNQLHNYLIPIKDVFDGLGSEDLNTCKENFEVLNNHLDAYSNYFE